MVGVVIILILHHRGCGRSKCEDSAGYEIYTPSGQHKGPTGLCEIDLTEAQEAATRKAKRRTKAQQVTSQPQQTTEALVLESECDTPCGADIPHNFQIHTEGHALCVRSSGESTWACYPAEGNFPLKSPIHPGWAEFRSDDGKEFHVQIYKRITVPQQ